MYEALGQCAKVENTSLSDIIREALVEKMSQVEEKERQRVLKEAEYEARLRELGVDPPRTACCYPFTDINTVVKLHNMLDRKLIGFIY